MKQLNIHIRVEIDQLKNKSIVNKPGQFKNNDFAFMRLNVTLYRKKMMANDYSNL